MCQRFWTQYRRRGRRVSSFLYTSSLGTGELGTASIELGVWLLAALALALLVVFPVVSRFAFHDEVVCLVSGLDGIGGRPVLTGEPMPVSCMESVDVVDVSDYPELQWVVPVRKLRDFNLRQRMSDLVVRGPGDRSLVGSRLDKEPDLLARGNSWECVWQRLCANATNQSDSNNIGRCLSIVRYRDQYLRDFSDRQLWKPFLRGHINVRAFDGFIGVQHVSRDRALPVSYFGLIQNGSKGQQSKQERQLTEYESGASTGRFIASVGLVLSGLFSIFIGWPDGYDQRRGLSAALVNVGLCLCAGGLCLCAAGLWL
jgi:hypothetical protein